MSKTKTVLLVLAGVIACCACGGPEITVPDQHSSESSVSIESTHTERAEYVFLPGKYGGTTEDDIENLPKELMETLDAYFDLFDADTGTDVEMVADPALVNKWREEYRTHRMRDNGAAEMDSDYAVNRRNRYIEGYPYLSEDLCFVVISYDYYMHYLRLELRRGEWFVTDDEGNGFYESYPYGYNQETAEKSSYPPPLNLPDLSAARKMMHEVYSLICNERPLSKMDVMPAINAVKTGVLGVIGLTDPRVSDKESKQLEARECFSVGFSDRESTEKRVVDWLLANRGGLPDRIPRVFAKVTEVNGHAPVCFYYENIDEVQSVRLQMPEYFLVSPSKEEGDKAQGYWDRPFTTFKYSGLDDVFGHAFGYDFAEKPFSDKESVFE